MWWLSQSPTPTLQGHQTNWFFTFKAFMSFTVKIFKTMSLWKVTQYLQMWQKEPQWTWCKNYGIPGFPLLWLKFSNTFGKNSPQTPPSCLAKVLQSVWQKPHNRCVQDDEAQFGEWPHICAVLKWVHHCQHLEDNELQHFCHCLFPGRRLCPSKQKGTASSSRRRRKRFWFSRF